MKQSQKQEHRFRVAWIHLIAEPVGKVSGESSTANRDSQVFVVIEQKHDPANAFDLKMAIKIT